MDTTSSTHSPLVSTDATATRHPGLYFPTGDLVVSARATDDGGLHLFRAHTVILGQFSPVFADMLRIPSGNQGRETYDGVPVVHFPDEAKDVAELFGVFYRPGVPHFERNDSAFPTKVYGLMKIATKYEVDSVCQAIKSHLESEWPKTVVELLRLKQDMVMARKNFPPGLERDQVIEDIYSIFPEPAAAIRLAMDFDIANILPVAFYILSGIIYDPMPSYPSRSNELTTARFALLQDQDLLRYYRGRNHLMQMSFSLYRFGAGAYKLEDCWFKEDDDEEGEGEKSTLCEETISELEAETSKRAGVFSYQGLKADPIGSLANMREQLEKQALSGKLCHHCFEFANEYIGNSMQQIWDDLPKIFNLPKPPEASENP